MADLGAVGFSFGELMTKRIFNINVAPVLAGVEVAGTVFDVDGDPASRIVRVYRRSDGAFVGQTLSDATTGAYSVACPNDEVQRIVLDDDAGSLFNDIIDRVLPG